MQIRYTNELYYPVECSILFMRKLATDQKSSEPLFSSPEETLRQLRESYGDAAEAVAAPMMLIAEVADHVWSRCSFPEETLRLYFSQTLRGGYSVGNEIAHVMRTGKVISELEGEKRFEALQDLVIANLLNGPLLDESRVPFRTETELFDFIDRCDSPEESKWAALRFYYHIEEYEQEVGEILAEAERHFREKEAPLRPLWEAAIGQIRANVEEHGVSFLRDNYHIKPDGEELLVAPSVMLVSAVSMQSMDMTSSVERIFMWFGFLVDEIEQLSRVQGANGELLSTRLKAISDKRRLEILCALRNRSLCGQELAELTGLTPATVSHHMGALLNEDFVNIERVGTRFNYSLSRAGVEKLIENLRRALL